LKEKHEVADPLHGETEKKKGRCTRRAKTKSTRIRLEQQEKKKKGCEGIENSSEKKKSQTPQTRPFPLKESVSPAGDGKKKQKKKKLGKKNQSFLGEGARRKKKEGPPCHTTRRGWGEKDRPKRGRPPGSADKTVFVLPTPKRGPKTEQARA